MHTKIVSYSLNQFMKFFCCFPVNILLTEISQHNHLDRLPAHWTGLVPLLQFSGTRETWHEVSCFAMHYAAIFGSALTYDARLYAGNWQAGFHALLFVLPFCLLRFLTVLLAATKHAARCWRLGVIFTFLGLRNLHCFVLTLFHSWLFIFSHFHLLAVRNIKTFRL